MYRLVFYDIICIILWVIINFYCTDRNYYDSLSNHMYDRLRYIMQFFNTFNDTFMLSVRV